MLVREPSIELTEDEATLAARLEPEAAAHETLRLGIDRAYADWLDRSGNPFVPVATVLATVMGEDLAVEAPVSPALVRGAERASAMYAKWWGHRPATVEAPATAVPGPGPYVASMFSAGLDSTATVLRSLRGEIPERATHLLSMFGSEFGRPIEAQEAIWRDLVSAAAEYGLPVIRLTTNATDLLRAQTSWGRAYGASFASLALALGPAFGTVLFGSSQLPDEPRAHGSRHDLDPLWSTESTTIRVDAAELGKLGRAKIIASSDTALSYLAVCRKGEGLRNCGRCEKCLRTMTCLKVAGALDRGDRFDGVLTTEAIRRCTPSRSGAPLIRELVNDLPPDEEELRAAWTEKLREAESLAPSRHETGGRSRLRRRVWRSRRVVRRVQRRATRGLVRRFAN